MKNEYKSLLVIVESPAKARTIGKILGKNYEVLASMGHIRDLPEHSLGIDIANNFKPYYVENKSRLKVISKLRSAAKNACCIYLASDPDREGEAIAWHLKEILKRNTSSPFLRTTFHEITKNAVQKSFRNPGDINMNLVLAQQARRLLDRIVGFQISQLLWTKIEKGISAGRVQSVALLMVCERERKILDFVPEEYWVFTAKLKKSPEKVKEGEIFSATLEKVNNEKIKISNQKIADGIYKAITDSHKVFTVDNVEEKIQFKKAPPPFITSTMQQAAASSLGFSAEFTMKIAQQLYEGVDIGKEGPSGLITYMRTDSVNVAKEAQETCREFIVSLFGEEYLPDKPNVYKSKATAQEAHEAIRPTNVKLTPEQLKPYLKPSHFKLYTLIWNRFVGSQMAPSKHKLVSARLSIRGTDGKLYTFLCSGKEILFPGFMRFSKIWTESEDESKKPENLTVQFLGNLKKGMTCYLDSLKKQQKFTEPPPRFSEATLIRELEKNGIGRPSTYASIVNTIQKRAYVKKEKGKLVPTELGFTVNDYLTSILPDLFQIGFTAEMEEKLDKIETGQIGWLDMLNEFYDKFKVWLDKAKNVGAPPIAKVEALVKLFENFDKWETTQTINNRKYNDKAFFTSVCKYFNKHNIISASQWRALLLLALKYEDKLPNLYEQAKKYGFELELSGLKGQMLEKVTKQQLEEENNDNIKELEKFKNVLSAFNEIEWEKPLVKGNKIYDDKKFLESLAKQIDNGKVLSKKQTMVVGRLIAKYKHQFGDPNRLLILLNLDPEDYLKEDVENGDENNKEQPNSQEILDLVEKLTKVTHWQKPVKRGRRVFNDKQFFESLANQVAQKRKLSERQVGALKKLAEKYLQQTQQPNP